MKNISRNPNEVNRTRGKRQEICSSSLFYIVKLMLLKLFVTCSSTLRIKPSGLNFHESPRKFRIFYVPASTMPFGSWICILLQMF